MHFDDFDTNICIEEIIPEEYDDYTRWTYGGAFMEEEDEI